MHREHDDWRLADQPRRLVRERRRRRALVARQTGVPLLQVLAQSHVHLAQLAAVLGRNVLAVLVQLSERLLLLPGARAALVHLRRQPQAVRLRKLRMESGMVRLEIAEADEAKGTHLL